MLRFSLASATLFTYGINMDKAQIEMDTKLRNVANELYRKIENDPMIGFMFIGLDLERLAFREYQLMAQICDLPVRYEGQSLRSAHMRHRIRSGQFRRRLELLKQALEAFDVPRAEFEKIVAHNEGLAAVIMRTTNEDKACGHSEDEPTKKGPRWYG